MSEASTTSSIGATQWSAGAPRWLRTGSPVGALIAARDWTDSALGPIDSWPESLVRTTQLCLDSSLPLALLWGEDYTQLYNDAFATICQENPAHALGKSFRDSWAAAWPVLEPYV